nr:uncharacterized mitochondrial protein AtMg00810-like [Tanacetum cinerariifolium]
DSDGEDVDVHTYRSMIGSLMYLTSSRPDIMFAVCACVRFQVTPKVSFLNAVKRIFRYLKGKPYLGLWYLKDSPFDLVVYSDSDYAGASLDRKSTTGGCQFLGCRLISWQCKKQTVVATSSTEAEYVAAASGCAQVLCIQNQLLNYGVFNLPMLHLLRVEMVINSPWMLSKNWLVQNQTAFDKDISNLFMADNLPKIVWFSTHRVTFMKSWLVQKPTALGQMATGKEYSNPFMASSLPKTILLSFLQRICFHMSPFEFAFVYLVVTSFDSPLLGVNTPRSDEDRLELMELMFFLLQKSKSDAAKGFEQIIDFLSGSYIHYALTVNPHIYISCIKQFWNTTSVKRSGDVTRLQALVDKKKIVFSEVVIREILQWKFLIHTILQSLSAKRTSWNEFSTAMASAVICLSKEEGLVAEQVQVDDAVATAVEENVAEDVTHDVIPSPPSHAIPSPSQEPSSPPQQPQSSPQAPPQGVEFPTQLQQVLNVCSALTKRVENLENDNAAQKLVIIKLKAKGRMIDDMDIGIELVKDADSAETEGRHAAQQAEKQAEIYNLDLDHSSKVLSMQEDDSEVQEVVEVVTTARLITEVVIPAASQLLMPTQEGEKGVIIRDPEEELPLKTPAETPKVKDKGKGILVETPKPMKKKDQIELDAEYAKKLHEEINKDHEEFSKDIDWDAAMDHVNQKSKNPQYIKRCQGMKKRPQTESEARKNMMIYLKNTVGYKIDFFKGMIEEMEEEDQDIIKSINETPAQKAAKRKKLSEEAQEAEDLRKRLEVVDDEDDDVFIEATPLARKVSVMDYQIVLVDNKPRFKINKADETHQLYISFTTLLKNFDREDLENL